MLKIIVLSMIFGICYADNTYYGHQNTAAYISNLNSSVSQVNSYSPYYETNREYQNYNQTILPRNNYRKTYRDNKKYR